MRFGNSTSGAAESLVWNDKQKTFDADVSGIELPDLLLKISSLTGWEVYMEPGTLRKVCRTIRPGLIQRKSRPQVGVRELMHHYAMTVNSRFAARIKGCWTAICF